MTGRGRLVLFAVSAAVLAVLAVPAVGALPAFGSVRDLLGDALVDLVLRRHVANTVTGILFDVRAIDTMGEEFILFAAATGTVLLLRTQRGEREEEGREPRAAQLAGRSALVRTIGVALLLLLTVLGFSLLAHGHLTPGGGFQGGVVLAGALLLLYLLHEYDTFDRVASPSLLERVEAVAAGAFALIGLVGLVWGGAYLLNVLGPGPTGSLLSGGLVPVLNVVSGIAVGAATTVIVAEFVEQAFRVRGEEGGK